MLAAICGVVSKINACCTGWLLVLSSLPFSLQLAGLVVHHTTTLPLPALPSWLGKLQLAERPPAIYSGASLEVQRQQRMEELERTMMTMYQRQVGSHQSVTRATNSCLPYSPLICSTFRVVRFRVRVRQLL